MGFRVVLNNCHLLPPHFTFLYRALVFLPIYIFPTFFPPIFIVPNFVCKVVHHPIEIDKLLLSLVL